MKSRIVALSIPVAIIATIVMAVWWFVDRFHYGNASSLHRAVMNGDAERVRKLIAGGADLNARMRAPKFPFTWDATPLHLAAAQDDVSIIEELILAGADKDAVDRLGYTPLHRALESGADAAAQMLLHAGAALRVSAGTALQEVAIEENGTPMRIALQCASIATVKAMIAAGADPLTEVGVDAMGWTDAPDLLPKLQLLFESGFSIEGEGWEAQRALHVAARHNDISAIEFLLSHGANIEARGGDYQFTPLLSAAYAGANDSIEMLIVHGASPRAATKNFGSPLYVAAFAGRTETVRLLLDMHLDIDVQAGRLSDNATPLHMAHWNADPEMVRLLIEAGADPNTRTTDGRLPGEFRK